jgi:hypothetical protein
MRLPLKVKKAKLSDCTPGTFRTLDSICSCEELRNDATARSAEIQQIGISGVPDKK